MSSKDSDTLMTTGKDLSQFDGTLLKDASMYRSMVGSLQYYTLKTPDISFSIIKLFNL